MNLITKLQKNEGEPDIQKFPTVRRVIVPGQSLVKVGGKVMVLVAMEKQCCVVAESVGTRFTAHTRQRGRVADSQTVVLGSKNTRFDGSSRFPMMGETI